MKNKYSFSNIVNMFYNKYYIVLLCAVLCGILSFVFSKFIMPKKYESFTSLYVKNMSEDSTANNVNLSDLNASKSLVETYIEVLNSNALMNNVSDALCAKYSMEKLSDVFEIKDGRIRPDSVRECLTMSASNKTEVLKVSARTKDPKISSDMCNSVAEFAPEFLTRIVGAGSVEVIDKAVPEYEPVEPNVAAVTLAGVILGFIFSCGFIFVIDLFDNTVKDKDSVIERYKKPVLGSVQHISIGGKDKKRGEKGSADELILNKDVPFNYIESYKSIRTNVMFSLSTKEGKILVISSPNPDEGKSTVAVNLATALAQNGERVLLIDADMRKPVLHKMFKISNKSGLSTTIIGISKFEQSVTKDVALNLDILTSGPTPPNPSELLASKHFRDLLVDLEGRYDFVIVDSPPINIVSDGLVFTDIINGILLILRYRKTTYNEVAEAISSVELANANLIGFIINDVSQKRLSPYYRKDGYYAYKS